MDLFGVVLGVSHLRLRILIGLGDVEHAHGIAQVDELVIVPDLLDHGTDCGHGLDALFVGGRDGGRELGVILHVVHADVDGSRLGASTAGGDQAGPGSLQRGIVACLLHGFDERSDDAPAHGVIRDLGQLAEMMGTKPADAKKPRFLQGQLGRYPPVGVESGDRHVGLHHVRELLRRTIPEDAAGKRGVQPVGQVPEPRRDGSVHCGE